MQTVKDAFHKYAKHVQTGNSPTQHMLLALVKLCIKSNVHDKAVGLWDAILQYGIKPGPDLYYSFLHLSTKAKSLALGRAIHHHIILNSKQAMDKKVLGGLLNMYVKNCASKDAVLLWKSQSSHIMQPYKLDSQSYIIQHNEFNQQQLNYIMCIALTACKDILDSDVGDKIHNFIMVNNINMDVRLCTALIGFNIKCNRIPGAIEAWRRFVDQGATVDSWMYCTLLSACARNSLLLTVGKEIHAHMLSCKCLMSTTLFNSLANMYIKCGFPQMAIQLWKADEKRTFQLDSTTYTLLLSVCNSIDVGVALHSELSASKVLVDSKLGSALILMYVRCHCPQKALDIWKDFKEIDQVLYANILYACTALESYTLGEDVYAHLLKHNIQFSHNEAIVAARVSMYIRCGMPTQALQVWEQALQNSFTPSVRTYVLALTASANAGELQYGEAIHNLITSSGIAFQNSTQLESSIINMYVKCGKPQKAFSVWQKMDIRGVSCSNVTYISVFTACADMGSFKKAQYAHQHMQQHLQENEQTVELYTSLISMYSKVGSIACAEEVFKALLSSNIGIDVRACTAMISSYAMFGWVVKAFELLEFMQANHLNPASNTITSVLNACAAGGCAKDAIQLYYKLETRFGHVANSIHQGCAVDALAKAGCPTQALEFVEYEVLQPHIVIWNTLITSCKNNVELAEYAAQQVLKTNAFSPIIYKALYNIYASQQMWTKCSVIDCVTKTLKARKIPGLTEIELHNTQQTFVV